MGWAKYMEDNYNMIEQRRVLNRRDAFIMPTVSVDEPTEAWDVITPRIKAEPKALIPQIHTEEKKKEYVDKILRCRSCGCDFRFSARRQEKFEKKGWQPPKRCWECRNREYEHQYAQIERKTKPTRSSNMIVMWVA